VTPDDQTILDALRAGRAFTTGGIEARDHESYEWSLEVRCDGGDAFIITNTTIKGCRSWTNDERFDEPGFLAYLDGDPSLRESLLARFRQGA
jgi:hypothetical protein